MGTANPMLTLLDARKLALIEKANEGTLTIAELAGEAARDWKRVNYAAVPYLNALYTFQSRDPKEMYGYESAKSCILYFLSNATTWRGPVARAIKADLKRLAK